LQGSINNYQPYPVPETPLLGYDTNSY
jgi:hypothetical protein